MLQYIPKYVRQESDMEYGDLVTHENYNEKLNLNSTKGDYNTEVLDKLLNSTVDEDTYHIAYVDAALETHTEDLAGIHEHLDTYDDTIAGVVDAQDALQIQIDNFISGDSVVNHATMADRITGATSAANNTYYGKDDNGVLGFINLPEFIYAIPVEDTSVDVDGVYFTPQLASVTEAMLTADVREKLNRANITDYDMLDNRPSIASVVLTGNKTLAQLGIQPAGNYASPSDITSALTNYYTQSQTNTAINNKANETYNNATNYVNTQLTNYVTNSTFNPVSVKANAAAVVKVGSSWPSGVTPKTGDILITV